jgi:hypothetical protein
MPDKPYSERPMTPQGPNTGFTSVVVPGTETPPGPELDPYRYQPAAATTRPGVKQRQSSSNYADATAAALKGFAPLNERSTEGDPDRPEPRRAMSFSKDDQKKMMHDRYFKGEGEHDGEEKDKDGRMTAPKSPGVGNSEMMGREYGFTSAG